MTKAGVNGCSGDRGGGPGDTKASGDSDVYAVFYVEGDPVWAEQEAEISDPQLESSLPGRMDLGTGEPDSRRRATSGNVSGNPHTPEVVSRRQSGTSHSRRSTMTVTPCSSHGDLVRPVVDAGASGSTAIAEVAFNLVVAIRPTQAPFVVEDRSRRDPPAEASLPLGP